MQRALAIFVAFSMGMVVVGCSKNKATQQAGESRPEWELTLKSPCDQGDKSACTAAYGFTVMAGGHFQMGPAPAGQIHQGEIKPENFDLYRKIESIVSKISANPAEKCEAATAASSGDSVTLARRGSPIAVFRETAASDTSDEQICFITQSSDDATALHDALIELANTYYSNPFPDACQEAADRLTQLSVAPGLTACATDADCAYITSEYEVVAHDASQYVETDKCTLVKPLAVANLTSFTSQQKALKDALSNAQSVCGQRFMRDDCTGYTGFQSAALPVCVRNQCQINPSNLAQ